MLRHKTGSPKLSATVIDLPRFDPAAPGLLDDPYSVFEEYRRFDPVHWGIASMRNLEGSWYLFRFDDNAEVLQNAEVFANDPATAGRESSVPPAFRPMASVFQRWLGGRDGDDHRRLRSVLAKAFTPRRIAELRPRVEEITDKLISQVNAEANGGFDVVRDVAFPLPMAIVGDALGVREADWHLFQDWASQIANAVDKASDPDAATAGGNAIKSMVEYFEQLIARRRVEPVDDLLGAMITEADDQGKPMDERDVIAIATELGFAGHETAANSIGKSVLGLMAQREQWDELRTLEGPALDKAIDELLRWTCPVQRQRWRWATRDTTLAGKTIERGQSVVSVLAAANRDPDHFPNPNRIDFHRTSGRHMTFGLGNHFCLGHQLARMELRTAITVLANQFPDMRLDGDPAAFPWKRDFGLPGPKSVPVRV